MKYSWIFGAILLVLHACSNSTTTPTNIAPVTTPDTAAASFFPVTSFLKGQITILDSMPVTPMRITTIKQKTDSGWIQKKDLLPLLAPFLEPEIGETNLTRYFKETKFNDQTLNTVTFTYDPIARLPDSISLRHWDVYVDPQKGIVSKVYLVKIVRENNQRITQQLTWQTNKWAKIATILNKPDGSMELIKETVYSWDF